MEKLPSNRRHSPVHICLLTANALLSAWLLVIFTTANVDRVPVSGLNQQTVKMLLSSQAD